MTREEWLQSFNLNARFISDGIYVGPQTVQKWVKGKKIGKRSEAIIIEAVEEHIEELTRKREILMGYATISN